MIKVDAHAHLWDPAERAYGWLVPSLGVMHRRYDADRLSTERARGGLDAAVVVQAAASEEETRALLRVAVGRRDLLGVVGWVDMDAADPGRALARLAAARGGERLVGVRVDAMARPAAWLGEPRVVAGLAPIAGNGLAIELLVDAERAHGVVSLADAVPGARIVVDHLVLPPKRARELAEWTAALESLASRDAVFLKLSGLAALEPAMADHVVATVLGLIPAERLMFGSDWPVCLTARSYEGVVAFAQDLLAQLEPAAWDLVWGGAAVTAYRLPIQT